MRNRDPGPEDPDSAPQPYEHPALESEAGYWAGRWVEFKRQVAYSWHNNYVKEVIYLCVAAWLLVAVVELFNGWA